MAEKLPNVPDPEEIPAAAPGGVELTTLSNGVRVASQDLGGPVAAIGLYVGAGSRNENPYNAGMTHMLERLAYKGSTKRSKYRMVRDMERTGAMFTASSTRETVSYSAEGMRELTGDMVAIITESALTPMTAVSTEGSPEWDMAVDEIKLQAEELKGDLKDMRKDAGGVVTEAIHAAAFHGNSLGKYYLFLTCRSC